MGSFTFYALCFLMILAHLGECRRRFHHRVFAKAVPKKLNRVFLEQYAKRSVDEFNKQSDVTGYKYVLLNVIGGRAIEETKTLEIMAKFGRTRCQKTEDRYFCQTSPELRVEETLFKVNIRTKTPEANPKSIGVNTTSNNNATNVEFKFEEKPVETLPLVQKLFVNTIE